jgi:Pyruvate/2-oxoacid:ferredoxin oxidoreductase delta subunit
MKSAIAIDDWKFSIFERHLAQAGYAYKKVPGLTANTMLLTVNTENVEALEVVVRAANTEAARTDIPAMSSCECLTCVYCGMACPKGTPSHGEQILTDHIKVCEKHPLRAAEATIAKLRSALVGMVGADGKDELETMETMIRISNAPAKDKAVMIDALNALMETA